MKKLMVLFVAITLSLAVGLGRAWAVEKIFFSSYRANPDVDSCHIWMMNPDGTGLEQLTFGNVIDARPELSPDGTKLVFARSIPPNRDCSSIWVRDLITGIEMKVTTDDFPPSCSWTWPTWSPDGRQIAFSLDWAGIWVVDFLPSVGVPFRISPPDGASRLAPSWSPDGTNILYMREVGGYNPFTLYKINVTTGVEEQVLPHGNGEYLGRYSPDGTRITWTSFRHSSDGDIYVLDVIDPLGSQRRVTPSSGFSYSGWSPDGEKLVFMGTTGGAHIWVINLDGTGLSQLTLGPATDQLPWWGNATFNLSEIRVTIDIKPGSFPNSINPLSKGVIPVAILTTATFDATTVDLTTVRFGATGTESVPAHFALEDVDGDGDTDLILHFNTQDTGIVCGATSAFLTGKTLSGQAIEGSDSIKTVGCK